MSAPTQVPPGRSIRRRRWLTGAAVAVVVLVVALAVLAFLPRSATATASLTVTPRTDTGAEAALLLADRYTELARSAGTARNALAADPALADVSADGLSAGTRVERAAGTATITVRVTLPDRGAAAAAANAVVDTLVAAGGDEVLVDVDRGAEAVPSRAVLHPDLLRWTVVAALLSLACGLVAGALAGPRARRAASPAGPPEPASSTGPADVVDDLPGFLENPPGSAPPTVPAPVPAQPVHAPVDPPSAPMAEPLAGAGDAVRAPASAARHAAPIGTVTAVVVLVAGAVFVGAGGLRSSGGDATGAGNPVEPSGAAATLTAPTGAAAPGPGPDATVPTTSAPASATASAAAARAFESVPLGPDGVAASVTFEGVVLEQRAVGLTVTYPSVSVTTDGRRSLAHVRFPTFNCLTTEPPADPLAAGCVPSITEYADLADPQLQVSRRGDRLELVGLFPTYTRPNGTAPGYTGRAYQLTAAISADGPGQDGRTPAVGMVRIGLGSAPTTEDRRVNLLQLPY